MRTPSKTRARPGLLLLGALLLAPAAPAGELLRFGWKPGLELRYHLRITGKTTASMGERHETTELRTRLHLTQRVLAVGADGAARILTRVESGKVQRDQAPSEVMPPREGSMRMDDRGTVLDGSAVATGAAALQLVFPEGPISVGDSWYNSLPATEEIPVPIRVRYTVLGTALEEGYRCLRIGVQIESVKAAPVEAPIAVEFEAAGSMLFAPDLGVLIDSLVTTDMTASWMHPGPEGPVPVSTRVAFDIHLSRRP